MTSGTLLRFELPRRISHYEAQCSLVPRLHNESGNEARGRSTCTALSEMYGSDLHVQANVQPHNALDKSIPIEVNQAANNDY